MTILVIKSVVCRLLMSFVEFLDKTVIVFQFLVTHLLKNNHK